MPTQYRCSRLEREAKRQYERANYVKAVEIYSRALGQRQTVALYDSRAACYMRLNDLDLALKDAKQAILCDGKDATGYHRAGKVMIAMKKDKIASDIYARGLRLIKHFGQGYELLKQAHDKLMAKLHPSKAMDPLTVLPPELACQILKQLNFTQMIAAERVSKVWSTFMRSQPSLWKNVDLGGTSRLVRNDVVYRAMKAAQYKVNAATLGHLANPDKVLADLIRYCPLEKLTLQNTYLRDDLDRDLIAQNQTLKEISIGHGAFGEGLETWRTIHLIASLRCQTLEVLKLDTPEGPLYGLVPNIFFPNLTALAITCQKTALGFPRLVRSVSTDMPALQMLTLRCRGGACTDYAGRRWDLGDAQALTHLTLENLPISSLDDLQLPPTLESLNLSSPLSLSPVGPATHFVLPNLMQLTLELSGLDLSHVTPFVTLPQSNSFLQTQEAFEPRFSKLTSLTVQGFIVTVHFFKDDSPLRHPRFHHLRHLAIRAAYQFSDMHLQFTVNDVPFPDLETLDLGNTDITGVGVKGAVLSKRLMTKLVITDCPHVSDDAIEWARYRGVAVDYWLRHELRGNGKKIRYSDD